MTDREVGRLLALVILSAWAGFFGMFLVVKKTGVKHTPSTYVPPPSPEQLTIASMSSHVIVHSYRSGSRIYFELDDGRRFEVSGYKGCHLRELKKGR